MKCVPLLREERKELPMNSRTAKFTAALFLFGSNGIVAGMISMGSRDIVLFRTMIGALVLIAMYLIAGRKKNAAQGDAATDLAATGSVTKKDKALVICSGLCMGISWMFLYEAFASIGVGISTIIYYTAPIALMMLSPFIFGEKLTARKAVCFSAVVMGMLLINIEGFFGSFNARGIFCAAMSAVFFVLMLIFNKKSAMSGLVNSVYQLAFAFVGAAVICFTVYGGVSLPATLQDVMWLVILGVVNTGIGCFLYFSNFSFIPVQTVSILGYIEPVSAIVLSAVILGENMSGLQAAGIAVVILASLAAEIQLPAAFRRSAKQSLQPAHRS